MDEPTNDVTFDVIMSGDAPASSAAARADTGGEAADQSTRERKASSRVVRKKGRGFRAERSDDQRYQGRGAKFDALDEDEIETDAQKSVEGWIVFVTGIHEEAQEDDVYETFAEFGDIKQLHLNLDRRTGFVKGYALVEFETYRAAEEAIQKLNGSKLLEKTISVSWAFKKAPKGAAARSTYRGRGSRR